MKKIFLFLLVSFAGIAQSTLPEQGGYWVHDNAGILSPQTKAELEAALKAERDTTSNQIAVLTIPSLGGSNINDYALKVFEKWKIGQAKKDNGVLFLIAPNERKVHIEVGYGLEGALTDALASRIIRNEVAPFFRTNNFDAGVKGGVLSMVKAVEGQYKQEAFPLSFHFSPLIIFVIIILIFMLLPINGGRNGRFRKGFGHVLATGFPHSGNSWTRSSWSGSSWGGGGMSGGGGASASW